jgi:hypothetical protein
MRVSSAVMCMLLILSATPGQNGRRAGRPVGLPSAVAPSVRAFLERFALQRPCRPRYRSELQAGVPNAPWRGGVEAGVPNAPWRGGVEAGVPNAPWRGGVEAGVPVRLGVQVEYCSQHALWGTSTLQAALH